MNPDLIVFAVGIIGAVAMLAASRLRRDRAVADLGAVSHQWLAEQRLGRGHDLQR